MSTETVAKLAAKITEEALAAARADDGTIYAERCAAILEGLLPMTAESQEAAYRRAEAREAEATENTKRLLEERPEEACVVCGQRRRVSPLVLLFGTTKGPMCSRCMGPLA